MHLTYKIKGVSVVFKQKKKKMIKKRGEKVIIFVVSVFIAHKKLFLMIFCGFSVYDDTDVAIKLMMKS